MKHVSSPRSGDPGARCAANDAIDGQTYRRVLANYPTGVCAITACSDDGVRSAMVVGSFTAVSIEPPLVGFLPLKTSSSWSSIKRTGRFCVNVLGADQRAHCRQLATTGCDKYADIGFGMSPNGSPILEDAVAWIDCAIEQVTEAGDHDFVLGRVLSMGVVREDHDPMIFLRGKYGGFAERPQDASA